MFYTPTFNYYVTKPRILSTNTYKKSPSQQIALVPQSSFFGGNIIQTHKSMSISDKFNRATNTPTTFSQSLSDSMYNDRVEKAINSMNTKTKAREKVLFKDFYYKPQTMIATQKISFVGSQIQPYYVEE